MSGDQIPSRKHANPGHDAEPPEAGKFVAREAGQGDQADPYGQFRLGERGGVPAAGKVDLNGLPASHLEVPPVFGFEHGQGQGGQSADSSGTNHGDLEFPKGSHVVVLPQRLAEKPGIPTVAYLDDFKGATVVNLNEGFGLNHGEFSAQPVEAMGWNVQRLQRDPKVSLTTVLTELAQKIDNGDVKLGQGDVLNVSIGWGKKVTFQDMSRIVGFDVTAASVKGQRQEILAALDKVAIDPAKSDDDRAIAREILTADKAVQSIRAHGIEILTSGGNDGPNVANWRLMNADHQFANLKPDGQLAPSSADNSLTERKQGTLDIGFHGADLFSPTPIARQQGYYDIAGRARLPAEDFGGLFRSLATLPGNKLNAWTPGAALPVDQAHGTSFSNIDYLSSSKVLLDRLFAKASAE